MMPAQMSTRLESTWFDQRYWIALNDTPTTRMAGSTSSVSLQLTIARTSQNGTMIPVMGRIRPIIALRSDSGKPDTAASVCTGVPMAPHATGDVLASRLSAAAWNGLNPRPIMKAPAIATEAFMISNWPVNTETSYRYTAASTIQAIFSTPNPTPYRKLMPASETGIPNTRTATSTAVPAPAIAHQWGFNRSPASRLNSTRIGSAATRVEKTQLCSGSYTWVQVMAQSFTVKRTVSVTSGCNGRCFESPTTAMTRCGPGLRESSTNSVCPRPRWMIPVTPRGIVSSTGVTSRSTNRWWCPVPGRSSVAGTISTPVAANVIFTGPLSVAP